MPKEKEITKITLAINKEGKPYFGAALEFGDGNVGVSAIGFGIDAGARAYWRKDSCGLTSVLNGKESIGAHIKRSVEPVAPEAK